MVRRRGGSVVIYVDVRDVVVIVSY
jgi:hypothetical protein